MKYGLCANAGELVGIVSGTNIKLDMRNTPSIGRTDADYPAIVFRRVTSSENNQVNYARERIEIEIIGLRSSSTVGDDTLESIREILLNHFSGIQRTWGKFLADGTADPTGGLRLHCNYISTVEGFSQELDEKAHILIFLFNYLRS